MKSMSKSKLYMVCIALAVMSMLTANTITFKQMDFFGWDLTCGTFLIVVDYVIGDLVTEVYGFKGAKRMILLAFTMNLINVLFYMEAVWVPAYPGFDGQAAFQMVLGFTPRVLIASFIAFIVGNMLNAKVMDALHVRDGEKKLAWRCISSTVLGEFVDATIFTTIAFAGQLPISVFLNMVVVTALFKIGAECVLYPLITRHLIRWAKKLPEVTDGKTAETVG